MTFDQLRAYLLAKRGATEDQPFGPEAMVYKVMGKMFALVPVDPPLRISLKCDPGWATLLRESYPAVTPAYHFNKRHWNGVILDGTIPEEEFVEMIDHSYELVVKGLSLKDRKALEVL